MELMLALVRSWQTYVAFLVALVASTVYLIGEPQVQGLWIVLGVFAPAVLVLAWAATVPETHETFISGKGIAYGLVALTVFVSPLPLNVIAAVIAARRSLEAGAISHHRLLPLASGALGVVLVASVLIPYRRGVRLRRAIAEADMRGLRRLVRGRRTANRELPGDSERPLHLAATLERASAVAFLLRQGADVALENERGRTALAAVVQGDRPDEPSDAARDGVLAELIEGGSPITSNELWRLVDSARHPRMVAALDRRHFTPAMLRENPPELGRYLRTAIQRKENGVVEAFLAAGGDVGFRDADGRPLLVTAFEAGNDALAQSLMTRGADVTVSTTPPRVPDGEHEFRETDARDHLGGLEEQTVRMYFERAPTARLDKRFAYTPPLFDAASRGDLKVMALLLEKGSDIDYMTRAKTALHCAVMDDRTEAVRFLLAHGANVDEAASPEETALMEGCESHPEGCLVLLEHGARLHGGELPLAARSGHLALVKALVRRGADVNALDSNGNDARTNAACWGHRDVVDFLTGSLRPREG